MAIVGNQAGREDASGEWESSVSVEKGSQQQRLTALPVCEPSNPAVRQHPGYGRPFRVAKVEFDTFGEEGKGGKSKSRDNQQVRASSSGESWKVGRRSGAQYESFGDTGYKAVKLESMDSSARPPRLGEKGTSIASGASENIKELVGAMRRGNKGEGAGRVPTWPRRKVESSFDDEKMVTCLSNLRVPGCWLIDQAKAALEAGASGRLSFAASSINSVGRGEALIQSHAPQPREQVASATVDSVLQHVASFSEAKNKFENRRFAIDYDAAALAKISIIELEPKCYEQVDECPSIDASECESACSRKKCKNFHRIPLACYLLGMAISALFIGSQRKASGTNEASKELQL